MKNKIWLTVLLIMVMIAFAIGIRGYFITTHYKTAAQEEIVSDEELFYKAFVTSSEGGLQAAAVLTGKISIERAYQYLLSLSCMAFGKFAISGIYLNILLQLLSVIVLFLAVRLLSNSYIGFVVSMVLATIPSYIRMTVKASTYHLEILLWTVGFLLLTILIRAAAALAHRYGLYKADNRTKAEKKEEPVGMKEILPEDIGVKRTQFIENPLPVPKRKEHREMDYAIEPSANDDYDITDMTGKDFFDI